jgi:hypothetical protein
MAAAVDIFAAAAATAAADTVACLMLLTRCCCAYLQGSFVPLAPELSPLASNFKTDAMGRFNKSATTLGIFTWPANSSCVDRVTGLPLTYTWQLVSPVYDLLIVTDMTLLTMPASEGLPPLQQGQGEVFDRVYKIFGVDARKLQVRQACMELKLGGDCSGIGKVSL